VFVSCSAPTFIYQVKSQRSDARLASESAKSHIYPLFACGTGSSCFSLSVLGFKLNIICGFVNKLGENGAPFIQPA
jgi:hypothetical protein